MVSKIGALMGQQVSTQLLRDVWGAEEIRDGKHLRKCLKRIAQKSGVVNAYNEWKIKDAADGFEGKKCTFLEFEAIYVRLFREQLRTKSEQDQLTESVLEMVMDPEAQSAVLDFAETPCTGVCCVEGKKNFADFVKCNLPVEGGVVEVGRAVEVGEKDFLNRARVEGRRGIRCGHGGEKDAMTLFVLYGRRQMDWLKKKGEYGNHNPRFVIEGKLQENNNNTTMVSPEDQELLNFLEEEKIGAGEGAGAAEGAGVSNGSASKLLYLERYHVLRYATHDEMRTLLEAKNAMQIYFHRFSSGMRLDAEFNDGDIIQVERTPFRKTD